MRKFIFAVAFLLVIGATASAYQVTGPVLEVTDTKIVVQKGDDKWEVARDQSTKMSATPKVGDKVTIEYKMIASNVEIKSAGKGKK